MAIEYSELGVILKLLRICRVAVWLSRNICLDQVMLSEWPRITPADISRVITSVNDVYPELCIFSMFDLRVPQTLILRSIVEEWISIEDMEVKRR